MGVFQHAGSKFASDSLSDYPKHTSLKCGYVSSHPCYIYVCNLKDLLSKLFFIGTFCSVVYIGVYVASSATVAAAVKLPGGLTKAIEVPIDGYPPLNT